MCGDRTVFMSTFEFLIVGFARFYLGFCNFFGRFFLCYEKMARGQKPTLLALIIYILKFFIAIK